MKKAQTYVVKQDLGADTLIYRYSSWFALKKAFAWLIRFQTYLRYRAGKIAVKDVKIRELSVGELLNDEEKIVKHVKRYIVLPQGTGSTIEGSVPNNLNDVSRVSRKRLCNVSYSSPLRKLNPVVVNGTIRVGGRLGNADAVAYASNTQLAFQTSIT